VTSLIVVALFVAACCIFYCLGRMSKRVHARQLEFPPGLIDEDKMLPALRMLPREELDTISY
jgi:hypothetical protein